MALGNVVGIATGWVSGVSFGKSPRYGGGDGPLFSTVNGFADRVASGDVAVITQLNQLRRTDADKAQWQLFWDEMLPIQPLTAAQVRLIVSLDPTKSGLAPRTGTAIHAEPGTPVPTIQQVLQGIQHAVAPSQAAPAPAPSGAQSPPLASIGNPIPELAALPWWVLAVLAGVAGYAVYKMVKR